MHIGLIILKTSPYLHMGIWAKVFKNGPSKIWGRQLLKNLKWYGLLREIGKVTLLKLPIHVKFAVNQKKLPLILFDSNPQQNEDDRLVSCSGL